MEAPPKALLIAQTEEYVVYNRWLAVQKASGNDSVYISLESNDAEWNNVSSLLDLLNFTHAGSEKSSKVKKRST